MSFKSFIYLYIHLAVRCHIHLFHNTVLMLHYHLNFTHSMILSFVGTLLTQGTLGNWGSSCTVVASTQGGALGRGLQETAVVLCRRQSS